MGQEKGEKAGEEFVGLGEVLCPRVLGEGFRGLQGALQSQFGDGNVGQVLAVSGHWTLPLRQHATSCFRCLFVTGYAVGKGRVNRAL